MNKEADAIDAVTGLIPEYKDLKKLFKEHLDKDYSKEEYIQQFTVRINENIEKIDRIVEIYKDKGPEVPETLFNTLESQKEKLKIILDEKGAYISPFEL